MSERTCAWQPRCKHPAAAGVSIAGQRYLPICWPHILSAIQLFDAGQTVELAPLDFAFPEDEP